MGSRDAANLLRDICLCFRVTYRWTWKTLASRKVEEVRGRWTRALRKMRKKILGSIWTQLRLDSCSTVQANVQWEHDDSFSQQRENIQPVTALFRLLQHILCNFCTILWTYTILREQGGFLSLIMTNIKLMIMKCDCDVLKVMQNMCIESH